MVSKNLKKKVFEIVQELNRNLKEDRKLEDYELQLMVWSMKRFVTIINIDPRDHLDIDDNTIHEMNRKALDIFVKHSKGNQVDIKAAMSELDKIANGDVKKEYLLYFCFMFAPLLLMIADAERRLELEPEYIGHGLTM